jgi:F-box-like
MISQNIGVAGSSRLQPPVMSLMPPTTNTQLVPTEEELFGSLEEITRETNPVVLQSLKQHYNLLVDLQSKSQRGPLPDPIENLPPEIWLHIFRYVGSGGEGNTESNPIDHLLLTSLVSSKWCDAILNTQDLWEEVTVDPVSTSREDELFKLQTTLYLSGERPLTLTLKSPSHTHWREMREMIQIISSHRSRIQKIFFDGTRRSAVDINEFLLSLGPLPQLRVVHVVKELVWSHLSWRIFLSNAPSLVSINIVLSLEALEGERTGLCCDISISESFNRVFPQLFKFQSLKRLSWWAGSRHDPPSSIPLLLHSFTNLGDLKELNYYQADLLPALRILQATFNLTTVSINIGSSWYILTKLMQALSLSLSLFELDIRLADPTHPSELAITVPTRPLAVRSLIVKYFPSTTPLDKRSLALGCRHITDLIDILDLCTPAVEEFYFYAGLTDYIPFKYISSRKHLFRLTLSLPVLSSIPRNMLIESKSLVCLNLKIDTGLISEFFRGLKCPALHRIVFLADDKYDRSLRHPMAVFDSASLPHVAIIEWRNRPVFWQITSLPALQKLVLAEWSRATIAEFCLYFVMRSCDCPALEYIEFGAIPEWDLLLMMLERRNQTVQHGVSRITTLVFPTAIPYSLLVPITELLNGRFAILLSYHDVSISSIAEFYFDTEMCVVPPC